MDTTYLSSADKSMLDAIWTLLRPLGNDVKRLLAARLEASVKEDKQEELQIDKALEFIKTLSVRSGEKVPADARGIDALLTEKYD